VDADAAEIAAAVAVVTIVADAVTTRKAARN
jgi:hypothetical protein